MRTQLRPFIGERLGGEPAAGEIGHFYLCKACGQPVDKRDLAAVFHHEEPGHEPLPTEDAERLLRITELLNAALQRGGRDAAE
jgi:hypothetical protein